MKMSTFTSVIRRVAKNIGRQHGIKVIFKGKQASTDKNTIILPAIPAGTVLTQKEEDEFFGLLDHEISHVKYTDFSTLDTVTDSFTFHILNILEDPRVELLFIDEYPGSKYGLDLICEKLEREFAEELTKDGEDLGNLTLPKVVTMIYEQAYLVRGRTPLRKETLSDFKQLAVIARHVDDGVRSSDTIKVKDHAVAIVELLKNLFPKDFEKKVNDRRPSPDMEEALEFLQWAIGAGSKGGSWVGQLLEENKVQDAKLLSELTSAHNKAGKSGSQILPPCGTHGDRVFFYPSENEQEYNSIVSGLSHEIASLKRGLRIFLNSRNKKNYDRGLEVGKLDSDAVWKIRAGEFSKLFKEKRTTTMVDTALELMMDLSGSMNEELAATAGILVSEALLGIPKLKLEIAGFTTNDNSYSGSGGRSVGLDIPLFKSFNDSGSKVRARLGGLSTSNYTPLGEAMAYAFESLLARKESKRVLWMVTDGQPTFPTRDPDHNDYLLMRKVYENCKKAGITVVIMCVGIAPVSMKPYCDTTVGVSSVSDLPSAVLDLVKELITLRMS